LSPDMAMRLSKFLGTSPESWLRMKTAVDLWELAQRGGYEAIETVKPLAVICQGGYRSAIAASLLGRLRPGPIVNVIGGTAEWISAGNPVETSTTSPAGDGGA